MSNGVRIGLIGDYDASVPAHQAIPIALALRGETPPLVVAFLQACVVGHVVSLIAQPAGPGRAALS